MSQLSRRTFLGGTALAAGAVAGTAAMAAKAGHHREFERIHYGPGPGIAKLNSNENPFGPSKDALEAMRMASANGAYYVDESVERLIAMIAERHGVTPDHITLSSGSSGVLTYLAVAKSKTGKILGPDLFWDTTTRGAVRQGGVLKRIAKTPDMSVNLSGLEAAVTDDVSMVQICNPNNPTAMMLPAAELRNFCTRVSKKTTVLVDEAYNEITDKPDENTMVSLVKQGHDVLVARTFSKIYGLAGMRVGYMIASPENSELIRKYSLGNYAMNQAGVAAAIASYNDRAFLSFSKQRILEARGMITEAVKANGLKAAPSQTSFVFVNLGDLNAETYRQKMADEGILIRGIYQDYNNWSRVSCGRIEDVQRYVEAMPKVLEAMKA